ncbi:MAG: disulfide bond formation protein B [Alphaproteobacteria bacterium]|jgi:disulfide bond formation protein DsbB
MKSFVPINRLNAAALLAGIGLTALAAALAFQHLGNLAPCALCIDQRKAWGIAILFSFLSLLAEGKGRIAISILLLVIAAIAALTGAGFAAFHVGVEQHWWAGTAECGSGFQGFGTGNIEDIRKQLLSRPVVRCDEIAWSFLGISMAGWNGLIALATGTSALYVVIRDVKRIFSK